MNKKTVLLLVLALVLSLTACGNKSEVAKPDGLEKITVVLDWTPNTNHTGLYVAKDKGYYEEAGLDVEIVQPPEDGARVLVASGKAQFGVSVQDSMAPALVGDNPLPIKAIAALLQHNTSGIISRKGEGMDRPKGLEGKKYATWDAPVEKAMMQDVVEKDGGDFSKVTLIPSTVTDEVSALKANSVDAIWVYYGWTGIAAEIAGLDVDYFEFRDINPIFDYYTPVLITNDEMISNNPEIVKKFLEATKKGYEFAIESPEEAGEILLVADPALDSELVKRSQEWISKQYKAEEPRWGYINPERWNGFYNWLTENNLSAAPIPENTGFTNEFLPE